MTENIPPMPEPAPKGKPRAAKTEPDFVFVENTRTSLFTLRWHASKPEFGAATERKFLGPGLNVLARTIADACALKGLTFEETFGNELVIRQPLAMPTHEATALAARTSSRQACHAWLKIETRAEVKDALHKRLAPKPAADVVDEDDTD